MCKIKEYIIGKLLEGKLQHPPASAPSCEPPGTPCASGKGDVCFTLWKWNTLEKHWEAKPWETMCVCLIVVPLWNLFQGNLQKANIPNGLREWFLLAPPFRCPEEWNSGLRSSSLNSFILEVISLTFLGQSQQPEPQVILHDHDVISSMAKKTIYNTQW